MRPAPVAALPCSIVRRLIFFESIPYFLPWMLDRTRLDSASGAVPRSSRREEVLVPLPSYEVEPRPVWRRMKALSFRTFRERRFPLSMLCALAVAHHRSHVKRLSGCPQPRGAKPRTLG